jgi:hypothetical protein
MCLVENLVHISLHASSIAWTLALWTNASNASNTLGTVPLDARKNSCYFRVCPHTILTMDPRDCFLGSIDPSACVSESFTHTSLTNLPSATNTSFGNLPPSTEQFQETRAAQRPSQPSFAYSIPRMQTLTILCSRPRSKSHGHDHPRIHSLPPLHP